MDPRLQPVAAVFRLNTRLLRNALDGVDDGLARRRPDERANHIAFIATHLVDTRYFLLRFLGADAESPFRELTDRARRLDDMPSFPTVEALLAAWADAAARLDERLEAAPAERLDENPAHRLPIDDRSRLGGLAFLAQHEAYHIGQIALLRRLFDLPPMSYAQSPGGTSRLPIP